jgi:transposase
MGPGLCKKGHVESVFFVPTKGEREMTQVAQAELNGGEGVLKVAFELAARGWRLASGVGRAHRSRQKSIQVESFKALREAVVQELATAKKRFGLSPSAPVVACYEAGRDAHWVRRFLETLGVQCLVIHASSTQVDRRRRRAKTDRLDAEMLLASLLAYLDGDKRAFRPVHELSGEAEDARQIGRHLDVLRRDQRAIGARVRSLLVTQGVLGAICINRKLAEDLPRLQRWDGSPLPAELLSRLEEEMSRWIDLDKRIAARVAHRRQVMEQGGFGHQDTAKLQRLRSLGEEMASVFAIEGGLGYRQFRNCRQVGAFYGYTPTPHASGESRRELGIGKDGSARVRRAGIEAAWLWTRLQPNSELTLWFRRRFGDGSSRVRRIGIVAVARKLMIALWRYLEQGIVPAGATLKA